MVIYKELPEVWQKKLSEEIEYVYKNGFILSSEAPESAKLSLVVGLTTNIDTNKQIYKFCMNAVPKNLHDKIFFQPYERYHVSIQ